ncbi:MAG: DUF2270 domain-containing protein [Halobacteriaceae archaeon]
MAEPSGDPEVGAGVFEESMGPGSSLAHLYRGEIHRMTRWRQRLDRTTNWAVTMLAAILTWSFSSADHPHYLLLIGGVTLCVFLFVEARRYRGYDMWRSRVRDLQENVWAFALDPGPDATVADVDWRARLSHDYHDPAPAVSFGEAVAHRLRRIYLPLFAVLAGAWVVRVAVVPPAGAWPASAAVGPIPGTAVTVAVALGLGALTVVAVRPREWRAAGELRTGERRD